MIIPCDPLIYDLLIHDPQIPIIYRTVKNPGCQKVWRKGLLQGIGKKTLANKACVIAVRFSIRNKHCATF